MVEWEIEGMTAQQIQPLVSVVIRADRADLLEISVRSALDQSLDSLELLLVDGDQSDGSALRRLSGSDGRIRLVTIDAAEIADVMNAGLRLAKGKYIAFLEAGDTFEADALPTRLQRLESDPDCQLVHGLTRLADGQGRDLGAAIGRSKAVRFDAAMHPVHLNSVTGEAGLLKSIEFRSGVSHHAGWLFFAEALRRGVVSHFVERGGATRRLVRAPDLQEELERFDSATRDVLDWIYAPVREQDAAPQYRQGLSRPVRTVARRIGEFPLFIWCLVSRNQQACLRMLQSEGLRAYLNTFMGDSLVEEIQFQCARQYLVNLKDAPDALGEETGQDILRVADALDIARVAPTLYFALGLCLGSIGRQQGRLPVDLIERVDRSAAVEPGLTLLTSFRTDGLPDAVRDCLDVMLENCANPLVLAVHVLLEGDADLLFAYLDPARSRALRAYLATGKLVYAPISARPDYRQILQHANTLGQGIVAVHNADIVVPEQTARQIIQSRREKGAPIYALSRWNRTPDGDYLNAMKFSPPWPQWTLEERSYLEKNTTSYDCYVFDAPFPVPQPLENVFIGTMGCDLAIVGCYRVMGMPVCNPCLSLKTLHVDNKPQRDYLGEKALRDKARCIDAIESEVARQQAADAPLRRGLANMQALMPDAAWLGGPGNFDAHDTLYRILGHALWESLDKPRRFSCLTISIRDGKLDSAKATIARHAQDIIDARVFIRWELSGFPLAGHIGDMIVDDPELEPIGYVLFRYKWQAMLHLDHATPQASAALSDLCEGIGRILDISLPDGEFA